VVSFQVIGGHPLNYVIVKNLEATAPVKNGQSKKFMPTHQIFQKLKEKFRVKKCCSKILDTRLETCKSELDAIAQSDITQLWQENHRLQHQIHDILSENGSLNDESSVIAHVIQHPETNQVHATIAPHPS
jgi:DNA anti-recombination protein RmuC